MKKMLCLLLACTMLLCCAGSAFAQGVLYEDTICWNAEYDVVVIGFGGAGAVSSIAASEAGAKVLLTEKAPLGHEGGNTRYCAQVCRYYGTYEDGMAYVLAEAEGYDTMTEEIADFIVRGTMSNPEWLTSVGLPTLTKDYVLGEYPELPGADQMFIYTVKNPDVTNGKGYWETVRSGVVARAENIDVWFDSPAKHLIQDPFTKTIIGVQIEHEGELLNVRAKNGVVLACGGFENNEEMVENYTQREHMYPMGTIYNTGDGVKMALEVGADLWHMNALSGPWITIKTDDMDRAFFNGMSQNLANNFACIYVGPDGTRFTNESGWQRHGHINYSGNYYSQMTTYPMYAIFDQTAFDSGLNVPPQFSADLSEELANGTIVKADTIAELAEKIGVRVDSPKPNVANSPMWDDTYMMAGLVNQVELYNQYCEEGFDHQFNRKESTLVPIQEGPFYAIEMVPAMVNTQGGAKRNTECEVLDTNGNPIPHLYSAGEFGSFYAGMYTGGGNVAETMFTGRVAGANAAAVKEPAAPVELVAVESNIKQYESQANQKVEVQLAAGQYMGTALGIGGNMVLTVTTDGEKITAIDVVSHNETAGISDPAFEQVIPAIIEANSYHVDAVAGATVTSNAIMHAVQNAMAQLNQ